MEADEVRAQSARGLEDHQPRNDRSPAARAALKAQKTNSDSDPRVLEVWDRLMEGLRKAGLPEE